MRIHSDTLTPADILMACQGLPSVSADIAMHGSRTRARGFEVSLSGTSGRRQNSGSRGAGDDYAATWDEWGMVLAKLFEADPDAVVGSSASRPIYASADDFHAQTADRFRTLTPAYQHRQHRWAPAGNGEQWCDCGATYRPAAR